MSNLSFLAKEFSVTADQTSETLTQIGDILTPGGAYQYCGFMLESSGGSEINLDQFVMQGRWHKDADWIIINAAAFETKSDVIVIPAASDMDALAHGTNLSCCIRFGPYPQVRFLSAQAGVTASAVTILVKGIFSVYGPQGDFS